MDEALCREGFEALYWGLETSHEQLTDVVASDPDLAPGDAITALNAEAWGQCLQQLGYAADGDAKSRIRQDLLDSAWGMSARRLYTLSRQGHPSADDAMLELMQGVLAFDGRSPLRNLPQQGELSLDSRVLHYRLSALGVFHGAIGQAFGPDTHTALRILAHQLLEPEAADSPSGMLQVLTLCGDVVALLHRLAWRMSRDIHNPEQLPPFEEQRRGLVHDLILVPDCSLDPLATIGADQSVLSDPVARYQRLVVYDGRFKEDSLFNSLFSYRELNPFRRPSSADMFAGLRNRLAVRWMCLALWQEGLYCGLRDGQWNHETQSALVRGIEENHLGVDEVLTAVGGGYLAVNLPLILARLLPPVGVPAATDDLVRAMEDLDVFDNARTVRPLRAQSGFWERIKSAFRHLWQAGRQVLSGFRHMLGRLLRALKRGVRRLRELLAQVGHYAVDLFFVIGKGIRDACEAVGRLIEPVAQFCLGRWVMTDFQPGVMPALATRFDVLDKDARHYVSPGASAAQIAAHRDTVTTAARVFRALAGFLGRVSGTLLSLGTGVVSWAVLAVRIAAALWHSLIDEGLIETAA